MTAAVAERPIFDDAHVGAQTEQHRGPRLMPVPDCEPPYDVEPLAGRFSRTVGGPFGVPQVERAATGTARMTNRSEPMAAVQLLTLVPPASTLPRPNTPRAAGPRMTHHRWDLSAVDIRNAAAPRSVPAPVPALTVSSALPSSGRQVGRRIFSTSGYVPRDELEISLVPVVEGPREQADSAGAALARAVLEVLSGRRPLAQLQRHCVAEVFEGLDEFPMLRGTTRLLSLWACEPTCDIAEISAAFRCGAQTRALAFRLQRRCHWLITALQIA